MARDESMIVVSPSMPFRCVDKRAGTGRESGKAYHVVKMAWLGGKHEFFVNQAIHDAITVGEDYHCSLTLDFGTELRVNLDNFRPASGAALQNDPFASNQAKPSIGARKAA